MNGHTVALADPAHEAARALLPWYAAERLDAADSAAVRAHLAACQACRTELEFERRLHAAAALADGGAMASPAGGAAPASDMEAALARLLPRLDATPSGPRLPWWRRPAANDASWLRWAVAAKLAASAGLAGRLGRPAADQGNYHVLGAAAAGGNLVVVFKPETAERELRRILQANGAHVVDGPTVTDAYLLSVPDPQQARARLRGEAAVALAETLDGGTPP